MAGCWQKGLALSLPELFTKRGQLKPAVFNCSRELKIEHFEHFEHLCLFIKVLKMNILAFF